MSNIVWSDKRIAERIKKGYGSGEGKDYIPWIHVKEVTAQGFNKRPKGWKTDRVHQFVSNIEFNTFLAFEWADNVTDIREQFPLERKKTRAIAKRLGIEHSVFPNTDVPLVMTTDMLLTIKTEKGKRLIAISVKESSELHIFRVLEKLEIERTYWAEQDIEWRLVTEKELNQNFTNNMEYIHNFKEFDLGFNNSDMELLLSDFRYRMENTSNSLISFLNEFNSEYNFESGVSLSLFRYCLANKKINIDMFNEINLSLLANEIIKE